MITVSAPGKIHLSGEHSVVYGQPALLASVEKRIRVFGKLLIHKKIIFYDTLRQAQGERGEVWDYSEIEAFSNWANEQWKKFAQNGDVAYLAGIKKDFWGLRKIAIGETYKFLKKEPKNGFYLELSSDLESGVGMGSSAAVAAVLVGAIFSLEGQTWDLEKINHVVYEIEKKMHGFPSGGDNSVVVYGGLLKFQKKKDKKIMRRLAVPKNTPDFILINTGRPAESTAEMVGKVRVNYAREENRLQTIFAQVGQVTERMVHAFEQGTLENLGSIIKKNGKYLEALSLLGEKAKNIVKLIETIGGSAKICGAGGVQEGSGVILAFHSDLSQLTDLLKKRNISFFKVSISCEGVRREKV